MTPRQYTRWKDFSLRMARGGWPNLTPARQEKLAAQIGDWFAGLEFSNEWQPMQSWDTSLDFWYKPDRQGILRRHDLRRGTSLACDLYSLWSQDLPGYWQMADERAGNGEWKFEWQLSCCIRAGMDMASRPSAGVLGFSVGDLRRMYPEGIPAWLNTFTTKEGQPIDLDTQSEQEGVWL